MAEARQTVSVEIEAELSGTPDPDDEFRAGDIRDIGICDLSITVNGKTYSKAALTKKSAWSWVEEILTDAADSDDWDCDSSDMDDLDD